MAETVSVKSKSPPKYEGQPQPYLKHRGDKEEWKEREQRNKQISAALRNVQRTAPATFHA